MSVYSKADTLRIRRYGYDALRITCAITVCAYHYECAMAMLMNGGAVPTVISGFLRDLFGSGLSAGDLAVCLFFMLSGALAARKTVGNGRFTAKSYILARLKRLLPPLWLSWTFLCVWFISRGIFKFDVPAWRFAFTVLGVDGYVAYGLNQGSTFYLCGEWFYGAIILVTLFWPIARLLLERDNKWLALGFALIVEMAAFLLIGQNGTLFWRSLPVCFSSTIIGASISCLAMAGAPCIFASTSLLLCAIGFFAMPVPETFRLQILGAGLFALIELREQLIEKSACNFRVTGSPRFHRVLTRLSDLALYFFMYQHEIIRWAAPQIAPSVSYTFGTFDYLGVAVIVILITVFVSALTQKVESGIRQLFA